MKKADYYLILGILCLSFLAFLATWKWSKKDGEMVRITIDGVLYGEYSLYGEYRFQIDGKWGKNEIVIQEGSVFVEQADCPDLICVKGGKAHLLGDSIVCLPHRLVIEICSEQKEADVDGFTQ